MRGILGGGHKPAGSGGEKAPDGPEVRRSPAGAAASTVSLELTMLGFATAAWARAG